MLDCQQTGLDWSLSLAGHCPWAPIHQERRCLGSKLHIFEKVWWDDVCVSADAHKRSTLARTGTPGGMIKMFNGLKTTWQSWLRARWWQSPSRITLEGVCVGHDNWGRRENCTHTVPKGILQSSMGAPPLTGNTWPSPAVMDRYAAQGLHSFGQLCFWCQQKGERWHKTFLRQSYREVKEANS